MTQDSLCAKMRSYSKMLTSHFENLHIKSALFSTTVNNTASSTINHLDRLLVELRLKIFRELLLFSKPIYIVTKDNLPRLGTILKLNPAILRTCRTYYQEAIGILYRENTFRTRMSDSIKDWFLESRHVVIIHKLTVHWEKFHLDDPPLTAQFKSMLSATTQLRYLTLELPPHAWCVVTGVPKVTLKRESELYITLCGMKNIQILDLSMVKGGLFEPGAAHKLRDDFLSGEHGLSGRKMRFFLPDYVFEESEKCRDTFKVRSHGSFREALDISICEQDSDSPN
ncbi:MAG: hypothetical protein M1820_006728 [Bogoriella megaspora]|nr:MAG: hypothetical protein M1820_006728 [Bogoriella megaspora]